MTDVCQHCNAQKWKKEPPTLCCSNGKVRLPLIDEPSLILKRLLEENTVINKHFRTNINKCNSAFQMVSFGTEHNLTNHGFFTTSKVQGQCYYKIGGLIPITDKEPKFVQVYFMGNTLEEAKQQNRQVDGNL